MNAEEIKSHYYNAYTNLTYATAELAAMSEKGKWERSQFLSIRDRMAKALSSIQKLQIAAK